MGADGLRTMGPEEGMMTDRRLTDTQIAVLVMLRARGADWVAEAAERNWVAGLPAFFDDRCGACRGLWRLIRRANREISASW